MNEFELIRKSVKKSTKHNVIFGAGDDCSVQVVSKNQLRIETTDCLVENIHFRRKDLTFQQLGFKSLVVNISDIAAMGGTPLTAHLTLAIDPKTSEKNVSDFFKGFYQLAQKTNIELIGGDLSSSKKDFFINIHLSGIVPRKNIQYRHDFKKADWLCVTGPLGDSSAGLNALLKNRTKNQIIQKLIQRHNQPPIELKKAQWLASQKGVHGMMDLSDGLMSDLERIPQVGFQIETTQIPISKELKSYCMTHHLNPLQFALAGGEDYRILFGIKKSAFNTLSVQYKKIFKSTFSVIGETNPHKKTTLYLKNKTPLKQTFAPFSHF